MAQAAHTSTPHGGPVAALCKDLPTDPKRRRKFLQRIYEDRRCPKRLQRLYKERRSAKRRQTHAAKSKYCQNAKSGTDAAAAGEASWLASTAAAQALKAANTELADKTAEITRLRTALNSALELQKDTACSHKRALNAAIDEISVHKAELTRLHSLLDAATAAVKDLEQQLAQEKSLRLSRQIHHKDYHPSDKNILVHTSGCYHDSCDTAAGRCRTSANLQISMIVNIICLRSC